MFTLNPRGVTQTPKTEGRSQGPVSEVQDQGQKGYKYKATTWHMREHFYLFGLFVFYKVLS